jgi:hypothetical protein
VAEDVEATRALGAHEIVLAFPDDALPPEAVVRTARAVVDAAAVPTGP